jgi:hypothetical protein
MLLMSAVSGSLQDGLQQQQSNQQQEQQQLSLQHSWQQQELLQRQQQPGSFSRLRSLLRWMPSAPIARGDAASLLPGVTQRSHSSMDTATVAAVDAATVRDLRNELCRDSVSSAARWDWLRQSQAGSPEASPDSMTDSLSRSSGSSMTSSLHSSRSSSRNSNGCSFRLTAAAPTPAAGDLVAGPGTVSRSLSSSDDGDSCVISIAGEMQQHQQQHAMEESSSRAMSSSCSERVDDGSCAGVSTATCSSSLASQQQLRQAWWQQQQQPGELGDPCAAGNCIEGRALVGPVAAQESFAGQSAAATEAGVAAIHPSEWLGFRSVGTPNQAGSTSAAAAGAAAAGCFVLDSRLLEEAAAAAAGGRTVAAGPSPFQLHYDFSALQDQ